MIGIAQALVGTTIRIPSAARNRLAVIETTSRVTTIVAATKSGEAAILEVDTAAAATTIVASAKRTAGTTTVTRNVDPSPAALGGKGILHVFSRSQYFG